LNQLFFKWQILPKLLVLIFLGSSGLPLMAAEKISSSAVDQGLVFALQATLTYHPALKGKQAELDAQSYTVDSAKAGRYPTLSLQANNLNDEFNQGSVRLQQPLWTFGKISSAIEQAEAKFSAQQWELLQVQRQLIEETAVTYARVQGIKAREQVASDDISQHKQFFQRIQRRQQGLLDSEADVMLARSRLIQARVQRDNIRGELLVTLSELQSLTQIYVGADSPVDAQLAELPDLPQVEHFALSNSADLQLKRERLEVAKLAIKQEKAASKPNLYLQVDHDVGDSLINTQRTRYGVNFVASYEGFGLRSRGQVKTAVARSNAAKYELDATINGVKRQVSMLMLNRQVLQNSIQSQRQVVDSLTDTLASFMRQYQSGRKSWMEVLNTQRELTQQRLQLSQIQNNWLILSLRVATMIGNLDQQTDRQAL
jgi:adhesin transport system outer membrane protein